MLNVQKIQSIKLGRIIRVLEIGENGTGKSTSIGSFPEPILYYDFDNRMEPVKRAYPNKDIHFVTVGPHNFGDFREHVESLQDRNPYKTVALDGITGFTTTAIVYQMILRGGEAKKTKGGIAIPGFDEYNGETMIVTSTIEVLKNLNCNVVVTAHPLSKIENVDGKSVRSRVIVSYGTKIASMVPGYFNEIYNFQIRPPVSVKEKPVRVVYTQHLGSDMAKTAYKLPPEIIITDRYDFYDILQSYIKEEESNDEVNPSIAEVNSIRIK
jgi:hypothetical protein